VIKKIAVITGGTAGIGHSIALKLKSADITVIVTSRNIPFDPAKEINDDLIHQQLDVTDIKSIEQFFDWLNRIANKIDFFINNAGIGIFKPIEKIDLYEWKSVIDTNLTGSFLCLKYALPFLKKANGARVIQMGSISENYGIENNSLYSASKLGLKALSRAINIEWINYKIFCTHVILGAVYTDIWKNRSEFPREEMLNKDNVATIVTDLMLNSADIRVESLEILPPKGVL